MEIEWGPWISVFDDLPNLGDYIQIEGPHQHTNATIRREGIVVLITETEIAFQGKRPRDMFIARWRRASLPEHEPKVTEKEVENV